MCFTSLSISLFPRLLFCSSNTNTLSCHTNVCTVRVRQILQIEASIWNPMWDFQDREERDKRKSMHLLNDTIQHLSNYTTRAAIGTKIRSTLTMLRVHLRIIILVPHQIPYKMRVPQQSNFKQNIYLLKLIKIWFFYRFYNLDEFILSCILWKME